MSLIDQANQHTDHIKQNARRNLLDQICDHLTPQQVEEVQTLMDGRNAWSNPTVADVINSIPVVQQAGLKISPGYTGELRRAGWKHTK